MVRLGRKGRLGRSGKVRLGTVTYDYCKANRGQEEEEEEETTFFE